MPALFPTLASQIKRLATVRLLPDVINGINLMVKGLSASFTLPATDFNDSVIIEKDQASAFQALSLYNDAAGANAHVFLKLATHDGASGDPYVWFTNGPTSWTIGLDNSDSDALVFTPANTVGPIYGLRIDAATHDVWAAANLGFISGTGFVLTFDHAITAPRTVVFQDLAGNVCMLGVAVAVPNNGHLLFVDGLWDIGQPSPPARPRDLFLARNAAIGGTLTVTGLSTLTGGFASGANSTVTGTLTVSGGIIVGGQPVGVPPVLASLGSNYALTNAFADIGIALTVGLGTYLVTLVCDYLCQGAGDINQTFQAVLVAGTASVTISPSAARANFTPQAVNDRVMAMQQWTVVVTVGGTLRVQAARTGGTGSSLILAVGTTLSARA